MSTTEADPRLEQRQRALRHANELRIRRAAERARLRALDRRQAAGALAALLLESPHWLEGMQARRALAWVPRMERRAIEQMLAAITARGTRTVGSLTPRQRRRLAGALAQVSDGRSARGVVRGMALAALLTIGLLAPSATPADQPSKPTRAHVRKYLAAYYAVVRALGHRAPGRQIVRWGFAAHQPATDQQVSTSLAVLERMLHPSPQPSSTDSTAPAVAAPPAATATSPPSSGGAGGVPACASESGTNYSTGPDNTNPSSGATGRYQVIPSTAAAYGCDLSTPAGQDACAQAIYRGQGAGAWVGCGG